MTKQSKAAMPVDMDVVEKAVPQTKRKVFRYYNGIKEIWGDPIAIFRRLEYALQGQALQVINEALASPQQFGSTQGLSLEQAQYDHLSKIYEAKERLIPAVMLAFRMKQFNPDVDDETVVGATEGDCIQAVRAWIAYYRAKKEQPAPLQT